MGEKYLTSRSKNVVHFEMEGGWGVVTTGPNKELLNCIAARQQHSLCPPND
jgi:hypothetical protein